MALGYRQVLQVEQGWRDLKQKLQRRPIVDRREDRRRFPVLVCHLGLMLILVAESPNQPTWARLRRELERWYWWSSRAPLSDRSSRPPS